MMKLKNLLCRYKNDTSGATAIEYALIAGLIGMAIVVGATTLGENLNDSLVRTKDAIPP